MRRAEALLRLPIALVGNAPSSVWREVGPAWILSRILCWAAGITAVLALGAHAGPHDPGGFTAPFGSLSNTLVGPEARWDSHWYLLIAAHGYTTPLATHFYPLYPLLARIVGAPVGSPLVGGIIVSLVALLAALCLLHRLVTLELGTQLATRTTILLAFFPTALFFSAVYTEGLFLALTVGAIYAARTGRWPVAGIAGGLAVMTRPTGIVIVVPLLILYLYGPRADRPAPNRAPLWPPSHRPTPEMLWLLAVPAGIGCYMAYLAVRFGDPFTMLEQGGAWNQRFTFPLLTLVRATGTSASGLLQIFHGHLPHNIYEFGYVCFAIVATIGALRRLPMVYGVYAACGVATVLSFPIGGHSLSGFSRYMSPLFPIFMWLAVWSSERRLYRPILVAFAVLMTVYSARFAAWRFVA